VRVRSSYTGGALGTPKNRERRDVDLISDVAELLTCRRDELGSSIDDLVFPGNNGSVFLSPTVLLRRQLYPAMAAAEIRRVGPTQEKRTFHSFRHTFAKRALESGAQITWLSRHLGHSSLKVTTDIYGTGNAPSESFRPQRWKAPSRSEAARTPHVLPRSGRHLARTVEAPPLQALRDGPGWNRTNDLGIKSPLLYQLSYRPWGRMSVEGMRRPERTQS